MANTNTKLHAPHKTPFAWAGGFNAPSALGSESRLYLENAEPLIIDSYISGGGGSYKHLK